MQRIDVIITDEVAGHVPFDPVAVEEYGARILIESGITGYGLNVVFIDDTTMTELNENYKHRTGTTDVLTFTLSDERDERREGEIYISPVQVADQAPEYGTTPVDELVRVLTHGLLHFAGYTHDTDDAMREMDARTEHFMGTFPRPPEED